MSLFEEEIAAPPAGGRRVRAVPGWVFTVRTVMRSGNRQAGWVLGKLVDGVLQPAGKAADPSTPIYQIVNDTALKEMLVSGWKPEDQW